MILEKKVKIKTNIFSERRKVKFLHLHLIIIEDIFSSSGFFFTFRPLTQKKILS